MTNPTFYIVSTMVTITNPTIFFKHGTTGYVTEKTTITLKETMSIESSRISISIGDIGGTTMKLLGHQAFFSIY